MSMKLEANPVYQPIGYSDGFPTISYLGVALQVYLMGLRRIAFENQPS